MKDATVFLVLALAAAIAGGVLGVIARAWAVVCVAVSAALIAAALLF